MYFITQGSKISGHGQGCRTPSDERYFFTIGSRWAGNQAGYVILEVSGYSFKPADSYRLFFNSPPTTGRLTWAVASSAQDTGKNIGHPIDHVCIGISACGDESDVFGYRRMSRAGILAIHYFVEILRIMNIGRIQITYFTPQKYMFYPY